jgi:hypothetical protein
MTRISISDANYAGPWIRIGSAGAAVTFVGTATHYDLTTWGPAEYRKIGDEIQLRGSITTANAGTAQLQFAAGWYPTRYVTFPIGSASAFASYIYIAPTNGLLQMTATGLGVWQPLDHIRFSLSPPT